MKDEKQNGEIAVIESQSVKLAGDPQERLKQGKEAAKALMQVAHPLELQKGKQYLPIGDWQTIGSFYGLSAGADESEPIVIDNVSGFRAKAVVRTSDGTIVSSAIGYCMNEGNWMGREKFAQASMAQTRACSKALRMVVGWVAVLGGYQDTPAEEMDYQEKGITQAHTDSVTQNKPKTPKVILPSGVVCPLCGKDAVDKRVWEDGVWTRQTSPKGKKFPAFQCIDNDDFRNPTCKGVIWDAPDDLPSDPHQLVDDDNLAEAEQLAKQVEEELPF